MWVCMACRAHACELTWHPRCLCMCVQTHRLPWLRLKQLTASVRAQQVKHECSTHRARTWLTRQRSANLRVCGGACACMRAHTALAKLVRVHATLEGAQFAHACARLPAAPTLLTGQLTTDMAACGRQCACMRAHTAPMLLMVVAVTSQGADTAYESARSLAWRSCCQWAAHSGCEGAWPAARIHASLRGIRAACTCACKLAGHPSCC